MNTLKFRTIFLLMLIFGLMLSACGIKETPTPEPVEPLSMGAVVAEGRILPAQDLRLSFSVRGTVAEVLVKEGDRVSKGQVIIRLNDWEQVEASLRAAELELTRIQQAYDNFVRSGDLATANTWQAFLDTQILRAEAEREWEDLNIDNLNDDIDDAKADVSDREEDLLDAQDEFDKYNDLAEENRKRKNAEDDLETAQEDLNEAIRDWEETVREVDSVQAALDVALSAEAEAKRGFDVRADDGLDPDEKALLEAQLTSALAQVIAANNARDDYDLKAPFAGTITDVNVEVGQFTTSELWAVQIADLTEFYVETSDLTELEVVKVHEGQTVEIVPDALPDLTLKGEVKSISQSFKTQAGDIVYTVKIHLNESDPALRWGMTLEITFSAE